MVPGAWSSLNQNFLKEFRIQFNFCSNKILLFSLHLFLHLVLERRRRLLLHNSACAFLCELHGKIEELNLEVIFSYISIYLSLFSLSFKNRCHFCRNETFSVRSRSCSLLSSIVAQSLEKGKDNMWYQWSQNFSSTNDRKQKKQLTHLRSQLSRQWSTWGQEASSSLGNTASWQEKKSFTFFRPDL